MYRGRLAALGLGLEDRMKSKVGLLSGGQRQALTLLGETSVQLRSMRSLANSPPLAFSNMASRSGTWSPSFFSPATSTMTPPPSGRTTGAAWLPWGWGWRTG